MGGCRLKERRLRRERDMINQKEPGEEAMVQQNEGMTTRIVALKMISFNYEKETEGEDAWSTNLISTYIV